MCKLGSRVDGGPKVETLAEACKCHVAEARRMGVPGYRCC
jgi:hypothetical protein